MLNEPAQLDLLKKLQEATTDDVDEERGSFKKGDKVTYDMLGGGLTNSDLIRTLGTNEHAIRANHNGTLAEIVEAIGEEVARYSIMFEDSFVINDVAASELKTVKEDEEYQTRLDKVSQAMFGEDYEDLPDYDHQKAVTDAARLKDFKGTFTAKDVFAPGVEESKTNEAEEAKSIVEDWPTVVEDYIIIGILRKAGFSDKDDFHINVGGEVVPYDEDNGPKMAVALNADPRITKSKEAHYDKKDNRVVLCKRSTNEAEDATQTMKPQERPNIKAEDYHMEDYSEDDLEKVKSKSAETGNAIRQVDDKELKIEPDKVVEPKKESKLKEQKHPSDNLTIGDTVKVLRGRYKGEVGEVHDVMSPDEDPEEMPEGQFDVKMSDGKMIYLGWDDVELVESKLKEETEFTPSRAEMKKISDGKLQELYKNALRSQEYWAKDRTVPEKAELAKQAVERYKEELVSRGIITGVEVPNETKESKFSFMKKQEPLWLCNECHKTFRADKGICENCKSENTEKIIKEQTAGFTKEVFQVTWKNTDTGKEESTRVMAFDKADAKKEAKRSNREIIKVEGPITKEAKEEAKAPFDESSEGSKVDEGVLELVGEVSGIDKEEQKILIQAIEKGDIPNVWPSDETMIDKLSADPAVSKIHSREDIDGLDMGEIRFAYLKYILLPKAKEVVGTADESKLSEQEVEGVPEKGQTYSIHPTSGVNFPDGNYEVTNVSYRWTVKGDLAKHFQIAGDDKWWIAKFYGFKEVASESKINEEEDWDLSFMYSHNLIWHNPLVDHEGNYFHWQKQRIAGKKVRVFTDYQAEWVERNKAIPVKVDYEPIPEAKKIKPVTAIEIVRSQIDPEAYNIRVVELPEGSIVILDSVSDKEEAIKRGKKFARDLNAEFLGIIDEGKVDEKKLKDFSNRELKSLIINIKRVVGMFPADVEADPSELAKIEAEISRREKLKKEENKESKLKEQEEDTFQTIAKGITDRADADKLAKEKEGQVIQDEEDRTKFAVLVRTEQ